MDLAPYIQWQAVPAYLYGLAMLALATFLLVVVGRSIAMTSFALYLVLSGIGTAITGVEDLTRDHALRYATGLAQNWTLWLTLIPLTFFVLHYPEPRMSRPARMAVAAAAVTAVLAAFAANAFGVPPYREDAAGQVVSVAATQVLTYVPLALTGFVAWLLARDLTVGQDADARRSRWLVVLGFTPYPIYRAIRSAFTLAQGSESGAQGYVWVVVSEGLILAALPLALLAWWRLVRTRTSDTAPWGLAALLVGAAGLGLATALEWVARSATLGTVAMVLPVVVTYALARHSLFNFDGKMRWTVKRGVVAGVILLVFLIGSQFVQSLTADGAYGKWGGAVLAGVALFAMNPIQRIADRVANAAVPAIAVVPAAAHPSQPQEDTYVAALRKFLADGSLNRDEERHLARLTSSLGIDAARAFDLREQVETELAGRRRARPAGKPRTGTSGRRTVK